MSQASLRRTLTLTLATGLSLSGITRLLRARRRAKSDFRIYILEYHGVDAGNKEWEGTISQARFRRHLKWLKTRFPFTTVTGAAERLTSGSLDRDWCVITFDDGYLNNVEGAFPVLQELKIPATIYLATGFLDGEELWFDVARRILAICHLPENEYVTPPWVSERLARALGSWPPSEDLESSMRRLKALPGEERLVAVDHLKAAGLSPRPAAPPMTWDQARLLQDAGIELGAHTVHHPILSKLNAEAQEAEIRGSVDRITEELGRPPRTFAMPNGSAADYDSNTLQVLQQVGIQAACTTRRSSCIPGCELLELPRLGIGSDTLSLLDARLTGVFDARVRRVLRRVFPFLR